MKNLIKTIVFGCVFGAVLAICGSFESHYSINAIVDSVSDKGTIFEDNTGNLWQVYDTNYTKGQEVKLYFYNNCTDDTRNDDVIDKVTVY